MDKKLADQVRIQYGGSVKPEGLKALLEQPDIDVLSWWSFIS